MRKRKREGRNRDRGAGNPNEYLISAYLTPVKFRATGWPAHSQEDRRKSPVSLVLPSSPRDIGQTLPRISLATATAAAITLSRTTPNPFPLYPESSLCRLLSAAVARGRRANYDLPYEKAETRVSGMEKYRERKKKK